MSYEMLVVVAVAGTILAYFVGRIMARGESLHVAFLACTDEFLELKNRGKFQEALGAWKCVKALMEQDAHECSSKAFIESLEESAVFVDNLLARGVTSYDKLKL